MKKILKIGFWILKSPFLRRIVVDLIDNGKLDGSARERADAYKRRANEVYEKFDSWDKTKHIEL